MPIGQETKTCRALFLLAAAVALTVLPDMAGSQSLDSSGDSISATEPTTSVPIDLTYVRPSQSTKISNYFFDAYGPYPIAGAAVAAGINQFTNSPPEWRQGVEGYSKRLGSDFAIAAVATTTRYGLAEVFKEDTLYYRCECSGAWPRMDHAVISAFTARRGKDGHRVFSLSSLVAPYAGTMTAVYGWYPDRFGAKDAFRMGNYSLLAYVGENIALEFFHSGPHNLLSRMHLNNGHAAVDPEPNK